jgi:putative transposase
MAEETGISASTINRIWKLFSVKPHKQNHFKLSTDPFFVDKVIDICGLYLNPPDNAMVLCVDEKSQCQALERTQPILPMGLGYAEGVTDNYYRHGVTTLFSALNVATGEVQIACKQRHRHQELLVFLNQLEKNIPKDLDVHVILDNYSTHKHEKIKAWIIRNPRFHFHFTPTYASWLNQVERWFGIITDKAIRRGSFKSVKELVDKIKDFTEIYNRNPKPFVWTATPEEILAKLGRLCEKMN